ncbi:hypothetical protein [Micromonospora sp. HM5-17]|uniref:hypothetical protein n=1 Tax=Micromonospora sp. HM5-17 TaxID=2487710 RepID=UPI0011CD8EFE|nr:hypothetical protein [Micromonospora sp. HM5-17]
MEPLLSPAQVRNRLILVARRIVADHAPDREGICPVCGVLHCEARAVAQGYLSRVAPVPPRPPLSVQIHRRAAVPPPGVSAAELRRAADRDAGAGHGFPDGGGRDGGPAGAGGQPLGHGPH